MSDTPFIYLLNRMESAASDVNPHMSGYPRHRKAVLEHVAKAESDLAEALALIRDVIGWVPGAAGWITKAPIESVERARLLLSKHEKGS